VSEIFNDDTLEHRCADGHYWREHSNGQVTPSWGLGGIFIDVADPSICPQPATDELGQYDCPSCEQKHRPGDGLRGHSCTPWEYGEGKRAECEIPRAACGKPAVWTRRWGDRDLPWPSGAPHALYTLWWIAHRDDRDQLVAFVSARGATKQVIDLHTGEILNLHAEDGEWDPIRTRKARLSDLPTPLQQAWPQQNGKQLPAGFDDHGKAPDTRWFLAHTNPYYMALCALHEEGRLPVSDAARQFMWAIQAGYNSNESGPGESTAITTAVRHAAEQRWHIKDVDTLISDLEHRAEQIRDEQDAHVPVATVQLSLAL
jgi:hypothetical protein